jgi:hypothetical protein
VHFCFRTFLAQLFASIFRSGADFAVFWYYFELNCIKFIIKISKFDAETAPSNGPIWDEE